MGLEPVKLSRTTDESYCSSLCELDFMFVCPILIGHLYMDNQYQRKPERATRHEDSDWIREYQSNEAMKLPC